MTSIHPIPAFNDNYIWCMSDADGRCLVVDPGDAKPVIEYLTGQNLDLTAILVTHHHYDHVGGINELLKYKNVPVYGPRNPAIKSISHPLADGDRVKVNDWDFGVLEVPGHTLDHIAYFRHEDKTPQLFCGDTLFSGGCGRLFEGTPEQMKHSLTRLKSLPKDTQVYCTHEYTLANLDFALALMPENSDLQVYNERCISLREQSMPTLPSSIEQELLINPFLLWDNEELIASVTKKVEGVGSDALSIFTETRKLKDTF